MEMPCLGVLLLKGSGIIQELVYTEILLILLRDSNFMPPRAKASSGNSHMPYHKTKTINL